jgi:hypothetical protein
MLRDELIRRYMELRTGAYASVASRTEASGGPTIPFRLTSITRMVLSEWERSWAPHAGDGARPGGWNWVQIAEAYTRYPDAFHLAIWNGQTLCGLSAGRPSRGHHYLAVDFLEGSPTHHPLKGQVLPLTIAAAMAYGRALGATSLRLTNPLPGVVSLYESAGFTLVWGQGSGPYCERRI